MTRIRSHVEKAQKISGPRALQPSQFGMVCPSDTPEGEQCGLVKSLTILAYITIDQDEKALRQVAYDLGVLDVGLFGAEELYARPASLVFLNGGLLGVHSQPQALVRGVRQLRRCGLLGAFVSVYYDRIRRCVHLSCDGGRICRPLLVLNRETGRPFLTKAHTEGIRRGTITIQELVRAGVIEYIDVNEENSCLIAVTDKDITPAHTHMEIDPVSILGIVASLIPYPDHNQSPRNTYQCAMGKQAIGTVACNQQQRVDVSPLNVMVYPMMPMVRSRVLDLLHFSQLPAGQNAMVAVMSYSGYDIEDAVVLNRASIDRGYGRVVISKKQVFSLKKYPNGSSDLIKGPPRREDQKNIDDHTWNRLFEPYKALGSDGIVESGVPIHPGDIMVNKHVPMDTGSFGADRDQLRAAPVKYKESGGYVDKVLITTTDNEYFVIKTMVRDMRRPELGDKFSSRHGQKGVVGLITGQENLPFSTAGIYPDMIMNPHGFPSRMTVGKMMELLAGKAGLWDGERKFGTIFGGTDIEDCAEELIRHGFNYSGKDMFYSGRERDGWVRDRHHRRAATRVYLHRSGVLSATEAHGEG